MANQPVARPTIDRDAIRQAAEARKDEAKQRLGQAKLAKEQRELLKANPVPQYVDYGEEDPDDFSAEDNAKADLDALSEGFRKRAADEDNRFALVTDTEFFACVCFQTWKQRDAFFAALKCLDLCIEGLYYDGPRMAERLGITIPDADVPHSPDAKPDPTWVKYVKE